jgi:hypothetical protein
MEEKNYVKLVKGKTSEGSTISVQFLTEGHVDYYKTSTPAVELRQEGKYTVLDVSIESKMKMGVPTFDEVHQEVILSKEEFIRIGNLIFY